MYTAMFIIALIAVLAVAAAIVSALKRQRKELHPPSDRSPDTSHGRRPGGDPEQTSHNLEYNDRPDEIDRDRPPKRDPHEADFAAEAHGFTGFENVDKGSDYKSGQQRGDKKSGGDG